MAALFRDEVLTDAVATGVCRIVYRSDCFFFVVVIILIFITVRTIEKLLLRIKLK